MAFIEKFLGMTINPGIVLALCAAFVFSVSLW
jgi:hypothetical protein